MSIALKIQTPGFCRGWVDKLFTAELYFFANVAVTDNPSLPLEDKMTLGQLRNFKWHDEIRG